MSKSFSIEFVPRYILTFAVVSREMDIIILYRERYLLALYDLLFIKYISYLIVPIGGTVKC